MLVINRSEKESFTIDTSDGRITVIVVRTGKNTRVGIDAPKECKILRSELLEKENDNASS